MGEVETGIANLALHLVFYSGALTVDLLDPPLSAYLENQRIDEAAGNSWGCEIPGAQGCYHPRARGASPSGALELPL